MMKRVRVPPATLKHLYESLHTFCGIPERIMTRLHQVGRRHKVSAYTEPQYLWGVSTRTLACPWPASLGLMDPDAHGPHLLGQDLHFSKNKQTNKTSRWRVCSRTKSGPWKLHGEAVSLSSLQLKRDSKTSPLTPEIWAFPQRISHYTLLFVSPWLVFKPFQGENTQESSPQNERPWPQPLVSRLSHPDSLRKEVKI